MRADLFPRIASGAVRTGLVTLLVLGFAGCKSEKDPDEPTVLGNPPEEAYLGVEYSYNFGAFGGDDILDYSLSNAPSWLALENTSNKARQGIIMRGVPGLSGGNRRSEDLGENSDINLMSTDGRVAGVQPFSIEVSENMLRLVSPDVKEGVTGTTPRQSDDACEVPPMGRGTHTYSAAVFNEDGSLQSVEERTRKTNSSLFRVVLDQPSVTPVTVAWEMSSSFDDSECVAGEQSCIFSDDNQSSAMIGADVVGLGSESENELPLPEDGSLSYQRDENGDFTHGLVRFEPGITECYIRVEVVEDLVPEKDETFSVKLTEVRAGLAAVGSEANDGAVSVDIEDNEPRVRLETPSEGTQDVINIGETLEYRAILTGDRDGTVFAKISLEEGSDLSDDDFTIRVPVGGKWEQASVVTFPKGNNEARFRVSVPASYSTGAEVLSDLAIDLTVDVDYAQGRENFAGAEKDAGDLSISINELADELQVGSSDGFIPTDVASGHGGRIFVAGHESGAASVRIYDRKGALEQEIDLAPMVANGAPPVIGLNGLNDDDESNSTSPEFAVSYGTEDDLDSETTSSGGIDVYVANYFYDDPEAGTAEYRPTWETLQGTGGDDIPRWVGVVGSRDYVIVTGETDGEWSEQTAAGGVDTFIRRIDTEPNGDDFGPKVAWTRQVGSGLDDAVAGGSVQSSSPLLAGSSSGQVAGEPNLGGEDYFFYTTAGGSSAISVYQRGSDADDVISDVVFSSANVWLLGNSNGEYGVQIIEGENETPDKPELTREPIDSQAGFLASYNTSGDFNSAVTLNDLADASTEDFQTLLVFDGDLIAGGSSNGRFVEDIIGGLERMVLARVEASAVSEDEDMVTWRFQSEVDYTRVIALANDNGREIVALVRTDDNMGGSTWNLVLFSGQGRQLNVLE